MSDEPTDSLPDGLVDDLVSVARARDALGTERAPEAFIRTVSSEREVHYENQHEKLGIEFTVTKLDFADLQTMDPRVVRIAPGRTNELHKHAHESLFVVIEGQGEVRVGEAWQPLGPGDVAFVPRWIFHQTRNPSPDQELVLLAITDYGFTSAALGDYDNRTRLAEGGDQADAGVPESSEEEAGSEPDEVEAVVAAVDAERADATEDDPDDRSQRRPGWLARMFGQRTT